MYTHILIATDGSELAQKAVDHGFSLARKLGSKVTVLTVTEPFPIYAMAGELGMATTPIDLEAHRQSGRELAAKILAKAKVSAGKSGVDVETLHVEEIRPAEAIIEMAREKDCNLIVMASHGRRGLSRLLLGSQTMEVLTYSPVPVLVIRDDSAS
jgi:nucleotide-binding universal stress UspA family protein